jgi:hypothetical protein
MPSTTLLLWVLTHSLLLPHQPVTFSLVGPGDFPAGRSVAGLIETGIPAVTSDRFDASGTGIATQARIGAYGESWTETTYRIGDLEATNPLRPGTAMVLPDATGFEAVSITASGSIPDVSTPGVRVALDPMRPADRRRVSIEGMLMPSAWAPGATTPPAIAALRASGDTTAVFSGPIADRVGAVVGVHWAQATHVARDRADEQSASLASATAHVVVALRPHEELRALVMTQAASHTTDRWPAVGDPSRADDRHDLGQLTWERRAPDRLAMRVSAGNQRAALDAAPSADRLRVDSVLDGAVLPLLLQPAGLTSSVRAEGVIASRSASSSAHRWRIGATVERHLMRPDLLAAPGAVETVNGQAARLWLFDTPATTPVWHEQGATLHASDVVSIGRRLQLDGSLRLETLHASNAGTGVVNWTNIYPRALITWRMAPRAGVSVFAGVARSGGPLPPAALALGDPSAPSARVYRWTDANSDGEAQAIETGALVARVGPGAWADGATAIDASLARPTHTQSVFGLVVDRERWAVTLTGIVRRQTGLLQVVDDGAAYARVGVPDEGLSYPFPPVGELDAYSRLPATFGLDAYRLTSPGGLTSDFEGLDAGLQWRTRRVTLAFGATAARTSATTTLRGFRVTENDPGLLDFAANPNGLVNAVGRPFFDRGYTGKIAMVVRLPARTRLGALIRYQDGQPFSRLADVDGLDQGPEPVSAYARGRTRFTFVSTVDVRLQKRLGGDRRGVVLFIDAFDLFNARREVEELVATTGAFRDVSAVEPPRTLRLGMRVDF